ncbi:MAG: M20/M25/M40 family metallo-hydrolase [Nitrospira sp.]|nr:M20/M25/M40 family metallo-hydrolase [Nitrospira sp.]
MRQLILSLWLVLTPLPVLAENQPELPESLRQSLNLISGQRMLEDVRTLSGPAFNGRQTGTPDDLASAEFVRQRFLDLHRSQAALPEAGTEPARAHESIRTQFAPHRATIVGEHSFLRLALSPDSPPDQIGPDYLPILDSPSADVQAPVVFVGYGISDLESGFDEYAGLDVRNKVVLFLRGKPERYSKQVSHADKARAAHAHGAIAYLTATGPILNAYEARRGVTGRPSAFYGLTDGGRTIPGAWISTTRAMAILQAAPSANNDRLHALQQNLNEGHPPQSTATDTVVTMRWHSAEQDGMLHNVIFALAGNDEARAEEVIVIGAHRDHFGRQGGLLFAGADDNASGTAVLLEVARVLHAVPVKPKRSIVLISFSGEEQGLLGSKFYIGQPVVPLQSTVGMINVDHAAVGNGRLTIGVSGMDKAAAQQAGQAAGLADRLDVFGFFPGGDHVPFKEAGVPTVTVVSGGVHPHFHQPTDTAETVDPDILAAAARYALAMLWQLADAP